MPPSPRCSTSPTPVSPPGCWGARHPKTRNSPTLSLKYCLPLVLPVAATHNRRLAGLIIALHGAAAAVAGVFLAAPWQAALLGVIFVSLVWELMRLHRSGRPLEFSIDTQGRAELGIRRAGTELKIPVRIRDYWRADRLIWLLLNTPAGPCRLWLYPPPDSDPAHRLRAWLHGKFYLKIENDE